MASSQNNSALHHLLCFAAGFRTVYALALPAQRIPCRAVAAENRLAWISEPASGVLLAACFALTWMRS